MGRAGPRCPPLRSVSHTERQIDFLHEIVLNFWCEVDQSDEVLADFGRRDGLSDTNGSLELFERRGGMLGFKDELLLVVLHI